MERRYPTPLNAFAAAHFWRAQLRETPPQRPAERELFGALERRARAQCSPTAANGRSASRD